MVRSNHGRVIIGIVGGVAVELVRLKTWLSSPAVAVNLKLPAVPLAVNVGAVATPEAFVTTLAEPANAPLAPLPGAVNVTTTPLTGLEEAFTILTASGVGNAVFIAVLWLLPPTMLMEFPPA